MTNEVIGFAAEESPDEFRKVQSLKTAVMLHD